MVSAQRRFYPCALNDIGHQYTQFWENCECPLVEKLVVKDTEGQAVPDNVWALGYMPFDVCRLKGKWPCIVAKTTRKPANRALASVRS